MQHHARLYVATSLQDPHIPEQIRNPGTDVDHVMNDTLTIDLVRRVIEQAHQLPLQASTRQIVIVARRCTNEAQNALLKVLEDPPPTTGFSLVVPSLSVVLPTVRSRVQIVPTPDPAGDTGDVAIDFLRQPYADRLASIHQLAKQKDSGALRDLIADCATWVSNAYSTRSDVTDHVLQVANQSVIYAGQSGASLKMLAEQLAVLLPVVTEK